MSEQCKPSDCAGCSHAGTCTSKPVDMKEPANPFSSIKKVIAVVSGKGGVGKSMVTASLARMMREQGFTVGIMDADITGPSIPKMYGVHGPAEANDEGIFPMLTDNGIRLMSINLLLPDEEAPVIWRGPVLANMVKQFWSEVMWGEVDYLLVDMPPGTGDVPLTVFQSLPVDGIVVVTSPQDLVKLIVKKALNMANTMNIPVLGLVENYSFIKCPDCGKEFAVFGTSTIDEVAAGVNLPVLGKLPIDLKLAELADAGAYAQANVEYLQAALEAAKEMEV